MSVVTKTASCLFLLTCGLFAWAGVDPSREQLLYQVRAADELARFYQNTIEKSDHLLAGMPQTSVSRENRVTYGNSLKSLSDEIKVSEVPTDEELDQLNDYQLKHILATLQLNNLELYVTLRDRLDQLGALGIPAPADMKTEQSLMESVKAFRKQGGAKWSQILQKYLNPPAPPPIPAETMMGQMKIASERQSQIENDDLGTMSPDEAVAAVLSGRPMRTLPPAPSTLAPLDARTANSFPMESVLPRTLPMSAYVPGALALRADPLGNPKDAMPSPETVGRLMSATGLSQQMAEAVASGRMSFSEALAGGSSWQGGSQAMLLSAADPRWTVYYYGPDQSRNGWNAGGGDFGFNAGGGLYQRFDLRLNNDSDMRINGSIDRRVNTGYDRRLNIQVDPRVNY